MKDYLTPQEVVTLRKWTVTVGTLSNWRSEGKGPRYEKFGWAVFYSVDELEKYERQHPQVLGTNHPRARGL